MDVDSRMLQGSTPRFAKILTNKYAQMSAEGVETDLRDNHGRQVSSHYVQAVFSALGDVLRDRELEWEYVLPEIESEVVSHIGIGRDGTTTHILGMGYKETMAGTISFYNKEGKRLTTIYLGCAPEKKKGTFDGLFRREIEIVKKRFADAKYTGIADGAPDNWTFLEPLTQVQIQDFFHVTEYIKKFAEAAFKKSADGKIFQEKYRTILRDEKDGAEQVLKTMKKDISKIKNAQKIEQAQSAITYIENHKHKMDYAEYKKLGYPIGSGVTEAACKTLIKQRLSQSGMKWTKGSVDDVLLARALILSDGRWNQFWNKIDRFGYSNAA
jgi:hypothetical protein